ncbi:site-specific integrase [Parabacteroides sp. PF5-6]|uniref:site-specific integrase n=1 Tax=Parabacteroides sp. PF5-6 TaxID=1742403 RepID=UPI002405C2FD|nr:site-specific integrase [Parabacteroides sp. PF5-6]MDF9831785.1 integrase/recombinase XerD [Parabacteroides sp. PF5-6]
MVSLKTLVRKESLRKDGKCRIEFLVYVDREKRRVSTGKSVEPRFWDKRNECVTKKAPDADEINKFLAEKVLMYKKFANKKEALEESVTIEEIIALLKGEEIKSAPEEKKKDLLIGDAFDNYIALNELRAGTIHNYRTTKAVICDFAKKEYKSESMQVVDFTFLEKLKKHLREKRRKPNNTNTVAKRLKIFRTIVRYSMKCGYRIENPFVDYAIENGEHRQVALTPVEYDRFYRTPLPKDACESMRTAKDIFIFSCETGLRYSDVMDLKKNDIDETAWELFKLQVKTGKPVFVPLSKKARSILIKHRNKRPESERIFPYVPNQLLNRNLKELAAIARIEKNVTSHVARHTFGTQLGGTGTVSAFALSNLMGHSDIKMTQRYVNLGKEALRETMEKAWAKI